ncbi:hypothetical protein FRC11_004479 [Ceratobasidium sp. 423]|nr:hypothetical protein FRC11_004479 [Ceratobasidium sp. 423]
MPEFRELGKEELVQGADAGMAFNTITIDTPVYLPYLLSTFLGKGGSVVRARIMHISQVAQGSFTSTKPDAIVVCTGIGARTLGGVEDKDVYPVRGQIVLIRAPWVKFGRTKSETGAWSYIIPRRTGDVILGGTLGVNDWYPHARPETIDDIISRTLAIAPEIAPPASREGGKRPTVEDVKSIIIETGCGFRPARKGGIRLETGSVEWVDAGVRKETPVVFNYGHGGYGYQSSWGSAKLAVDLLKGVL